MSPPASVVSLQSDPTADFDLDNDFDGVDFLLRQRGFSVTGVAATRSNGNADNDNDVDGADLNVWRTQFGGTSANVANVVSASPVGVTTAATQYVRNARTAILLPAIVDNAVTDDFFYLCVVDDEVLHAAVAFEFWICAADVAALIAPRQNRC